ncbi:MAG TPA: YHYH protein [Candidatus Sulfopaludibacter sp.]|nr:YHYH protein [Candidatus Sulfopaludibacter sp.]
MKIQSASKNIGRNRRFALAGLCLTLAAAARAGDPRTNSWFTTGSGQYARLYTNSTMQAAGTTLTTWSNGSQTQALPAYCGVQEVYSSSNWIYVRSTGLASYNMGPWYLNAQHTQMFPNLPVNQKLLFRFPRTPGVPVAKTMSGGGQIGIFVDGVAMFNSWDGYYWNGSADVQTGSDNGYWNRDAYVNEGVTFDAGYAHQQQSGVYHYHADPIGLRYELGDHVDYNLATKTYGEDTNAPAEHSPILAWTADGFPLYGPYGYSDPTNPAGGIRRMVSGYVPRNGRNGTDNLDYNGAARSTIPAWAQRLFGVSANQTGPTVSTDYPFGRYMEDNAYLGDLTNAATGSNYQQGVDFDLDEYNGRWCVTPEFPDGTYAYFVAIDSNGVPVFPYNIGRAFYGDPVGGTVSSISEAVVTNFLGYTNLTSTMNAPMVNDGTVTLTWSALEGGSYQVEATTNLADSSSWTVLATNVSPDQTTGGYTNVTSLAERFYRVGRTSVSNFDSAGTTVFSTASVAPGGSAYAGSTVTVTITLPSSPPWPPANAPISSVSLAGSISGTAISDSTQGTVVATFTIPANASTGAQNIVVTFQNGPTYTLTGGFTIE